MSDHIAELHPEQVEYTRAQLVKRLGTTKRTLSRWLSQGKFPRPLKCGSWERWTEGQVLQWKAQLRQRAEADAGEYEALAG